MRAERGFTLVELMVAVTIGAIIVSGLAVLAAGSTRAFHEEHRISEAQLELRFASERLRADLQRTGYLATADSAMDPNVNPKPNPPLVAVELVDGDGIPEVWLPARNSTVAPDRLRLLGAYDDSEVYLTQSIVGTTAVLDGLTESAKKWAGRPEEFQRIFNSNAFLRIENPSGFSQIIPISGSDGATSRVTLDSAPVQAIGEQAQGVMLLGRGHRVNVVNRIEYLVTRTPGLLARDETDPRRKTDLVRRELDQAGIPLPGTDRVVAEYVVDFDISFLVDQAIAPLPPNLQQLDWPVSAAWRFPDRIRGIRFRLSTRTREEDPRFAFMAPVAGQPLQRFKLDDRTSGAARVRTIDGTVVMPAMGRP